jgi:hypothetical protein
MWDEMLGEPYHRCMDSLVGLFFLVCVIYFGVKMHGAWLATQRRARVLAILSRAGEVPATTLASELVDVLRRGANFRATPAFLDAALPGLARLLADPAAAPAIEWFFAKIEVSIVLSDRLAAWLGDAVRATAQNAGIAPTVAAAIERAGFAIAPQQRRWLYDMALAQVTASGGNPQLKQLALRTGRVTYGSLRPHRAPTTYDEQAIANDIAVHLQA